MLPVLCCVSITQQSRTILGSKHVGTILVFNVKNFLCMCIINFTHYLINGSIFEKKNFQDKFFVLISCTTFVQNISHSKKDSTRYGHKYVLIFTQSTLELSRPIFEKNTQIPSLLKIRPVGAELLADRRTDGQP